MVEKSWENQDSRHGHEGRTAPKRRIEEQLGIGRNWEEENDG